MYTMRLNIANQQISVITVMSLVDAISGVIPSPFAAQYCTYQVGDDSNVVQAFIMHPVHMFSPITMSVNYP